MVPSKRGVQKSGTPCVCIFFLLSPFFVSIAYRTADQSELSTKLRVCTMVAFMKPVGLTRDLYEEEHITPSPSKHGRKIKWPEEFLGGHITHLLYKKKTCVRDSEMDVIRVFAQTNNHVQNMAIR